MSASSSSESLNDPLRPGEALGIHRGAIDQSTITTKPPTVVMKQVTAVLQTMGIEIQVEGDFKYRCIRPKRESDGEHPLTPTSNVSRPKYSEDSQRPVSSLKSFSTFVQNE